MVLLNYVRCASRHDDRRGGLPNEHIHWSACLSHLVSLYHVALESVVFPADTGHDPGPSVSPSGYLGSACLVS